jgi:hypothetical protein
LAKILFWTASEQSDDQPKGEANDADTTDKKRPFF